MTKMQHVIPVLTHLFLHPVLELWHSVEHVERLAKLLVDAAQVFGHLGSAGRRFGWIRLQQVLVMIDSVQAILLQGFYVVLQCLQDLCHLQTQPLTCKPRVFVDAQTAVGNSKTSRFFCFYIHIKCPNFSMFLLLQISYTQISR